MINAENQTVLVVWKRFVKPCMMNTINHVSNALVTKGLNRAKYNMGKYDEVIEFGMEGIEFGRYHQ